MMGRVIKVLRELIQSGFGDKEGYNCAQKIFYGANQVYELGLSEESLNLSAGFGGGAAVGELCGALCGAVMVLSHLYGNESDKKSKRLKLAIEELLTNYQAEMGSIQCRYLKADYRTPEKKCLVVIEKAAELLDQKYEEFKLGQ